MSKTFAQLSTGLPIFDRKRTLIHFNPALLDITGLDFEALSLKPDLASFLDTLRTKGFLPEPKDYGDWRDRLARLESAAKKGSYRDIWEPRDGVTYRVTENPIRTGPSLFCLKTSAPKPPTPAKPALSSAFWKTRSIRSQLPS